MKPCLFADREIPLRHLLQSDAQRGELAARVRSSASAEPASHHLREGLVGLVRNFASIGG